MPYLIDTCVFSELQKSKCNPGVKAWMSRVKSDELFISVLTLGEIRRGIELRRLKDPAAASALERWLAGLELHYADRLLPISAVVADRWGRLSLSQPLPISDGLIAATGLVYTLTVVTRNTHDFERSGVNIVNPFS